MEQQVVAPPLGYLELRVSVLMDTPINIQTYQEEDVSVTVMTSFTQVLDEIKALHDKKQADYGTEDDQFANIRASELFGFPAWVGAVMRAQDKIHRIQTFSRKGRLVNETVEDSLLDLAVYAVIALAMHREEEAAPICTPNYDDKGECSCFNCQSARKAMEKWELSQ